MTGDRHPEGGADDSWFTYRMDPDERPTDAVVMAVAAVRNVPALELERLHDVIETDALNTLFSGTVESDRDLRVQFTYADCLVEVSRPLIRVRELE